MAPTPQHTYRAALVRVVDGDTCILAIDLGCFVTIARTVRLLGLDTPEKIGATRVAGLAATQAARDWCAAAGVANPGTAWPLVVATRLDAGDKFGRLLATVYARDNPVPLNQALIDGGHAVAYDGGKRT